MVPAQSESRNAIVAAAVVTGGLLLAIAVIYNVLTTSGNSLAYAAKYAAIAGLVVGFVNPRGSIFLLVFSFGYLDLLKRLLILFDRPTILDLFYVLGIAPLLLAGVVFGTLMAGFFGRIRMERRHWMLFWTACGFVLLTSAFSMINLGGKQALKTISDKALYSFLLFVIPVHFRSLEEVWKLFRFALIIFIPVGIYGLIQAVNGLSLFEIQYLKSGLTIMAKELDDIRPRPFSTLNSAGALGFASSILAMLAMIPLVAGRSHPALSRRRWAFAALGAFYLLVMIASLCHSANLIWMVGMIAVLAFGNRKGTWLFYGIALSLYASLIVFAEKLIVVLPKWDALLPKSGGIVDQLTRIQTYGDRLRSFMELKNPDNWSLFGLGRPVVTHDTVTKALVGYGAVPLAIIIMVTVAGVLMIHRRIFAIPNPGERRVASLLMGIALATLGGGALIGEIGGIFPINAFVWIVVGAVFQQVLFLKHESSDLAEPSPSFPPLAAPGGGSIRALSPGA